MWRLFFDNLGLKVLSLLVALGFYASLHSEGNAQRTLQVPIVADMPLPGGNRVLVSDVPETVSVTIEGPRSQLDGLESRLDPIPLNLRGERDETVRFTSAMIPGLPRVAQVTRIIPETLDVRWEDVVERQLEVQVPIAGRVAEGFELRGPVTINPKEIGIRGADSLVNSVQILRAEPFELGGLRAGKFERNLSLSNPPGEVTLQQAFVVASVEVIEKLATRDLTSKVQVLGVPRGKAEPAVVRVQLSGSPERMKNLRPESVIVRVDPRSAGLDTTKPGSALLELEVDVTDARATVDPPKVVVRW